MFFEVRMITDISYDGTLRGMYPKTFAMLFEIFLQGAMEGASREILMKIYESDGIRETEKEKKY